MASATERIKNIIRMTRCGTLDAVPTDFTTEEACKFIEAKSAAGA